MTETLAPDDAGIARAASLLAGGGLVAFPTETVYGLGGDARSDLAVAGIYTAKGRPSFNPLIVHLPDLAAVEALAVIGPKARALALAFWPGPLTLVLPLRDGAGISPLVTSGLDTVAIRVPAHPLAQRLLRAFGGPVAAPSANPSGRISPTRADHVLDGLSGRIAAVLDGGPCAVGLESTIVLADPDPVLLRPGGVPVEALEAVLGAPLATGGDAGKPTSPGQLASHYAPEAVLRLNAT
jgi:L-threonylcarbamoyladenylate synthase